MGTTLAGREDSLVDTLLEVLSVLQVLAEEDETSTRTTEGLVSRGSDNITVLEGVGKHLTSDKTASVGNISHQESVVLICGLTKRSIIPIPGVG